MKDSKSIRELIEMGIKGEFCKLGYQRNYEWTVKEILALLETLNEGKFDIGTAKINIIDRDSEISKQCIPLEFMEKYSLSPTQQLWALVDFQQRLTTLLMFYNNHAKVKFIKYNIKEKRFMLSKSDKDNFIPVCALFNLMEKIEWLKGKDVETVRETEKMFDKMTQTSVNLEIHHNLSIEEQSRWFLLLNGTGKKVSVSSNKSCESYVQFGKSFDELAGDMITIARDNGIDVDKITPRVKYRTNAFVSLLLPFTNPMNRRQSVPIASNLHSMRIGNLVNCIDRAMFIIEKSLMFLGKNFNIERMFEIQTFIYFLSKVNYERFESKIVEDDDFIQIIDTALKGLERNKTGSARIEEAERVAAILTEALKK